MRRNEAMIGKYTAKAAPYMHFIFRILVGAMFFTHGAQKLFGWFGGNQAQLMSMFGAAGVIEVVAGIAIAFGVFTRLAAGISLIEMLYAYFVVHQPNGLLPIMNYGEPAMLFAAAFIVLLITGAKKWSVEQALLKKELF